jgi:hypothetical protein
MVFVVMVDCSRVASSIVVAVVVVAVKVVVKVMTILVQLLTSLIVWTGSSADECLPDNQFGQSN